MANHINYTQDWPVVHRVVIIIIFDGMPNRGAHDWHMDIMI